MWRKVACQVSRAVGGGREVEVHALGVHRHARQGHVVLPADQTADAPVGAVDDGEGAAIALAPDEALGGGGLELAVQPEQLALRAEVEQGAVERAAGGCRYRAR